MFKLKKVYMVASYNFKQWHKNPRIFITFALAFILCFLLSDKAVRFAEQSGTSMQILEAFVWTFGDINSIMLSSLLILILFADMPFITTATPFMLSRIDRKTFLLGQALYIILATTIYMIFILCSTTIICASNSFLGNVWSETAALLGYSTMGEEIALPSSIKVMTLSRPYQCAIQIFLLMLSYSLVVVLGNLKKGAVGGVSSVLTFTLYGFLLQPELIKKILHLSDTLIYKANVAVGWLSPLNQATYYMHNFGYDLLPRLWQTYVIFGIIILTLFFFCLRTIKKYNFNFTGTEG